MSLIGKPGHRLLLLGLLQFVFLVFLLSPVIYFQSRNQHDPFNRSFSQTSFLLSESQILCDGQKSPCGPHPSHLLVRSFSTPHLHSTTYTFFSSLFPEDPKLCPVSEHLHQPFPLSGILFLHLCGICLAHSVTSCVMRSPLILN